MILVLLAAQRSGTNMLRDVLDTHDHIRSLPEIFNQNYSRRAMLPDGAPYFLEYLEAEIAGDASAGLPASRPRIVRSYFELLEAKLRDSESTGIMDVKYNSLHHAEGPRQNPGAPPYMLRLFQDQGCRVIHLVRRNHVACALSLLRAHRTGVFRVPDPEQVERIEYSISPLRLINEAERIGREQRLVRQWLAESSLDTLEVAYEEMFVDRPGSALSREPFDRLAEFAGVPPAPMNLSPGSRRIAPDDIRDEIANVEEIDSALRDTEYYQYWQELVASGAVPGTSSQISGAGGRE